MIADARERDERYKLSESLNPPASGHTQHTHIIHHQLGRSRLLSPSSTLHR